MNAEWKRGQWHRTTHRLRFCIPHSAFCILQFSLSAFPYPFIRYKEYPSYSGGWRASEEDILDDPRTVRAEVGRRTRRLSLHGAEVEIDCAVPAVARQVGHLLGPFLTEPRGS